MPPILQLARRFGLPLIPDSAVICIGSICPACPGIGGLVPHRSAPVAVEPSLASLMAPWAIGQVRQRNLHHLSPSVIVIDMNK